MNSIYSCVALGSHWDRADHVAAATRMRAIAEVVGACPAPVAVKYDPSSGVHRTHPGQPSSSCVLWRRSLLHRSGDRATVVANVVATSCGLRSHVEFELRGHGSVKDMTAHVHLPIGMDSDIDCASVAGIAADVLERSIDDRTGRATAYRRLSDTSSALVTICRERWSSAGASLFQTVETFCATPWQRADALLHKGSDRCVMLRNGGRGVVAATLPEAMVADWKDETQQGTGQRTVLLTLRPYSALSIVSASSAPDAMTKLRANALLPLAEDQLCRLA